MKKFKEFLQTKGITDEAFGKLEASKQAELHGEYLDLISESLKGTASSKDVEEVKEAIKNLTEKGVEKSVTDGLQKKMDDLATKFSEMEENGGAAAPTFAKELNDFLVANSDKIKEIKNAQHGVIEFTPTTKAVGTITTAYGVNTSPPNIVGTQLAPLQNVNLREIPVLSRVNTFETDQAAYAYTEAVPKDGDFTFVAEGAAKPQIDFTWETNYAKPVKAAAWMKLTEESVQDVRGLRDVAENYLKRRHDLFKGKQILFGTGVAPNPTGATVYARTFSAGPLALSVRFTNFMDIVNAAVTDIATTHNYVDEVPYMANLVMINPVDFFINIASAKDERGLPLYPQASLFNVLTIGGLTIVPDESIPAGKIFVGDMEKYNITNWMPYTVKIGWINDDFIKNQFVILAESRYHAFVRVLDRQAFIYDDIATIRTAITAVVEA